MSNAANDIVHGTTKSSTTVHARFDGWRTALCNELANSSRGQIVRWTDKPVTCKRCLACLASRGL